jgi:rhomboid family GlyGly-CTERM serine protease
MSKITALGFRAYKHYASCCIIALLCIVMFMLPESISQHLVLTQDAFKNNEMWRTLSAHFMHTNLWHLLLNLAGLYLTWFLFYEQLSWRRVLFVMLTCTIGLSIVLQVTQHLNSIAWYVGLSGTLHGIFAFALVLDLKTKRMSTYVLIALGITKLLYEQLGGSNADTEALIGASVAIDAHLWGAVLGVLTGFIALIIETARSATK